MQFLQLSTGTIIEFDQVFIYDTDNDFTINDATLFTYNFNSPRDVKNVRINKKDVVLYWISE